MGLGLSSQVCGLARSLTSDVDACIDCGVDMVHVFIPTSDVQREYTIRKTREQVLDTVNEIITYARDHVDQCMFSPMDATRTDWDYLIQVCRTAMDAGATIINVPDTVGVITPGAMKRLIGRIGSEVNCPLDVHCHNDFGLAVANTLAAVEAGGTPVPVEGKRLGERAGKADLGQTLFLLKISQPPELRRITLSFFLFQKKNYFFRGTNVIFFFFLLFHVFYYDF